MSTACTGHRENENSHKTGCCYEKKKAASMIQHCADYSGSWMCYRNTDFVYTYVM